VGVASGAMPARVPMGLGRLAPVDDVEAMAAHVMAVWHGNIRAMGQAARDHVVQRFSWERTFNRLVTEVYPAAQMRVAERRSAVFGWAPPHQAALARSLV